MKIEDAIKRYESWAEDDRIDALIRNEHRQIADWLKELNADRPQGEWMHDTSSPIAYRCSACNTLQHWSVIQNGRYHFCPNCGARMKGADDETN